MKWVMLSVALVMFAVGCAPQPSSTTRPSARIASTQPTGPKEAFLALDELPDRPDLTELKSTTLPDRQPSLEAIELYARARGAILEGGQPFSAINLLERAIQADPDSFDLRFDLGKAYASLAGKNQQAIDAYEAAVKIRPDSIAAQTELGIKYLSDNPDEALRHLRLAVQTTEYQTDEDAAATADHYLALALQRKGYDRAAIDSYNLLLNRIQRNTLAMRGNALMTHILTHPEGIYLKVGQLYEKHRQYDLALKAYQFVLDRDPDDFDNQARVVNTLVLLGRDEEAIDTSIAMVQKSRASSESLKLLKSVFKQIGKEQGVIDELKRLQKPGDRVMLYALADTLYDLNRQEDAAKLLGEALKDDPRSLDIFKKLFTLYESRDETAQAARVWINYLADHPDSLTELAPLWDKLTRVYRRNSIRLTKLQQLDVPPTSEGCRLYLVSRQAMAWNRMVLARTAVEEATKHRPIFAPAFRAQMNDIWNRQEWDKPRKISESETLVNAVADSGASALAAELRGNLLLNEGKPKEAIDAFAEANKLGSESPDLQLTYALALLQQGNAAKFEQVLWKLISDRPTYAQGYTALFNYYESKQSDSQKRKVLKIWRDADPTNFHAQLIETALTLSGATAARNSATLDLVEASLLDIFRAHSDQPEAVNALIAFYLNTGKLSEGISRLENERQKNPTNRVVVQLLVELYAGQNRAADATRVLDAVRGAMGDDPDLLYSMASLYQVVDQPKTTEEVLAKVIEISPQHAAANNDLGYTWADRGANLDQAEAMIRIAVEAEPDNESFLDSLGWVLYKRARFAEAREYFERAIAPVTFPDPVVLDHLGDTLYRLNDQALAKKRWNEAKAGITLADQRGLMREELRRLNLVLTGKIRQIDQNRPVTVAPTAEIPPARDQAKK